MIVNTDTCKSILYFCFLVDNSTSKLQRCPNVVFIDRSKEYRSTAGYGPCHPYFSILVIFIIERARTQWVSWIT